MNRQTKRMMKRQEAADEARPKAARPRATAAAGAGVAKKPRTPIRQYVKESTAELKRVDWPTGRQVRTYTIVALMCIVVLGTLIAAFDAGVSELVLRIFA